MCVAKIAKVVKGKWKYTVVKVLHVMKYNNITCR